MLGMNLEQASVVENIREALYAKRSMGTGQKSAARMYSMTTSAFE